MSLAWRFSWSLLKSQWGTTLLCTDMPSEYRQHCETTLTLFLPWPPRKVDFGNNTIYICQTHMTLISFWSCCCPCQFNLTEMETSGARALGGYIQGRKSKWIFPAREGLQWEFTSSFGGLEEWMGGGPRKAGWQCSMVTGDGKSKEQSWREVWSFNQTFLPQILTFQHPVAPLKITTLKGKSFYYLAWRAINCTFHIAFMPCRKFGRVLFPGCCCKLLGVSGPNAAGRQRLGTTEPQNRVLEYTSEIKKSNLWLITAM